MSGKLILGIDPGKTGAIAILDPEKNQLIAVLDTPLLLRDGKKAFFDFYGFAALVRHFIPEISRAVIEDVHSMPGQGVASMFDFGKSFGIAIGTCAAFSIPISFVSPGVWKMSLGLGRSKDDSRRKATELFPQSSELWSRKKDDGRAEAALLAHFGKRMK